MVELMQVLEVATNLGVIAGVVFALIQLRAMKRDRWIGLMLQIADHATSPDFENALGKVTRATANDARGLEEQVSYQSLCMVADYLEYIAYLAAQGHIEKEPALDFFPFESAWEKLRPWIIAQREVYKSTRPYHEFELLAGLQAEAR